MSILKDLIFVFTFLLCIYFSINYFMLKNRHKELMEHFMNALIHDLKTPTLAQLRGIELIQKGTMGNLNDVQHEFISQIKESCNYTLDMISLLLKTYRMECGIKTLKKETFNITELLGECFETIAPLVKEKQLEFVYEGNRKNTFIEADKDDIKTVILHLLRNAVIYSDRCEKIFVSINIKSNKLKMEIKSKGMLIASKQAHANLKYAPIGEDIGFYLSKKIIKSYKGSLSKLWDGKHNSKFIFTLPSY